jgi:nucleoside 2-deoxyribosyltransferase
VRSVLSANGFDTHEQQVLHAGFWLDNLLRSIESASLVIADLSEDSPNVWYELGFAHALRKPTILLVNRDAKFKIPTDLEGQLFLPYRADDALALEEALTGALQRYGTVKP